MEIQTLIFTNEFENVAHKMEAILSWSPGVNTSVVMNPFNSLRQSDAYMCQLTITDSDNGLLPGRLPAII